MKFAKRFAAAVLVVAIIAAQTVFAADLKYDKAEKILKSSVVLCAKKPYYYANGIKNYFDTSNKAYAPLYEDGEIYVSVTQFKKIAGSDYEYDGKNSALTLKNAENTLSVRLGEDKIYVNGEENYYKHPAFFNGSRTLVPICETAKFLGIGVYEGDNIFVLAKDAPEDEELKKYVLQKASAMFFDGFYRNGFEGADTKFQTWSQNVKNGYDEKIFFEGRKSAYIDAVQKSMAAFMFPYVHPDPYEGRVHLEYDLVANVYVTNDYKNNEPFALLSMKKDGAYRRLAYAVSDKEPVPGEWCTLTFKFIYRNVYRNDIATANPTDSFSIGIGTRAKNVTEKDKAEGRIYFDDVRFSLAEPSSSNTAVQFIPDNDLSWYVSGDTVTYRAAKDDENKLSQFESVEGLIYNLDDEIVYKNNVSVKKLLSDGFSFDTKGYTGSFSAEFYGIRSDGTKSAFEYLQRAPADGNVYECNITKHRFAVAAKETKPKNERNGFPGINATTDIGMRLADKIGYSAVRYHYIRWGDSQLEKGTHTAKGVFDWTQTDKMAESMSKNDMKLMVNIFGSPKWALPAEFQNITGGMVAGGMKYNGYGIENQEYVKEYINAYLERYGKITDVIEFWNEPGAASAFWYDHDNDDVLIKMLKTVHECVEKYNSENGTDIKIAFAGFLRSQESWLINFMSIDKDSESYYDTFSIHGRYNQAYKVYDYAYKTLGFERKDWINSETYSTELYKGRTKETNGLTNFRLNALSALMNYFYHIKAGAKEMYEFRATSDVSDEYAAAVINNGGSINYWGLSTDFGTHVEPIPLSVILNVFFDIMGKDFCVDKEYRLNDSLVAVSFKNDGKTTVALWNSDTKSTYMDERLKDVIGENTKVMDFEGHTVDKNAFLNGEKLYWLVDVDEQKLEKIESKEDSVLNPNNVEPYFTAATSAEVKRIPVDELEVEKGVLTKGQLFDENTFNVINNDINWIEDGFKYVGTGSFKNTEKTEDFNAKFAASFTEKGFYLMVDVSDGAFCENDLEGIMKSYWNYDGIQLSFDTIGAGGVNDRMECAAAQTKNGTYFIKSATPDFGEELITDYTKKDVPIEKTVNISDTENGKLYKVFVPINEMYPMSYPNPYDCIRFSLLINNNNGDGRLGYLEWSSGIGDKKAPSLYGALIEEN